MARAGAATPGPRPGTAATRVARALLGVYGLDADGVGLAPALGLAQGTRNLVALERWVVLQLLDPPDSCLAAMMPDLVRALGALLAECPGTPCGTA